MNILKLVHCLKKTKPEHQNLSLSLYLFEAFSKQPNNGEEEIKESPNKRGSAASCWVLSIFMLTGSITDQRNSEDN